MAPPVTVRRLEIGEADQLQRIRLAALDETPEAFASTWAYEQAQPPEFWRHWLERNPPFGLMAAGSLRGLASFNRQAAPNMAHRGTLGAMYVAPELRGTGAAAQLVDAVLAHARTEVEQVHLSVTAGNARAEKFYRRMGFVAYGREPAGLKCAGVDYDVLLMVRKLPGRQP